MTTLQSGESLQDKLLRLPCHFSWEFLQNENVGRTVEMNVENLDEHIHEAIQGTEVMTYNLMGFYKTQQEHFEQARTNFEEALKYTGTEDERIVSRSCLAWLAWKDSSSDSGSEEQVLEIINQVQNILRERNPQEIPEVMAEKAFAIANSGFTEKSFEEALDCIDKALEKRPDNVMYKFTKASILQQIYLKRYKNKTRKDGADAQKIKQIWKDLIASLETNTRYPVLYAQALIQYALFLNAINWDYGQSGKKYAEKAENVARFHQATAVMRNVARFYVESAGNCYSQLDKAEAILNEIVNSKPNGDYKFKALTNLAHCLFKKYEVKSFHGDTFAKAEECFRRVWDLNKKYPAAASSLVRLYQKNYDKTEDISALVKAEKIIQELFLNYDRKEQLSEAIVCSAFGCFMKGYGKKLASFYRASSSYYQGTPVRSSLIEEALQLIYQYTQDKQDKYLLQAEQIFRQLYNSLEELRDPVKACFQKEYAVFLDRYSDDLAFCYLIKSLEHNPYQVYTFKPLEELARGKIASQDKKEQIKGYMTIKKINQLQERQENSEQ